MSASRPFFLLIWASFFDAAPCMAQDAFVTLTGTVSDSATLAPLGTVAVYIEGWNIAGWTNADGDFRLAEVTRGEYVIALRKPGYLPRSFRFSIDRQTPREVDLGDLDTCGVIAVWTR